MILIREAIESDIPFVLSTWLKSVYTSLPKVNTGNKFVKIKADIFYNEHQKLIKQILSDNKTFMLVACAEDYPDQLFGYACANNDCLHYVYVKQPYRCNGVAKGLINELDIESIKYYSHLSPDSCYITKLINAQYNPYIFTGASK